MMLESLKRAFLSRRHSPEYAEHRLRVERMVERLPEGKASAAWRAWLWRLPPEAWLDAVDLKTLEGEEAALREAEVRAMTRMGRAGADLAAERDAAKEDARGRREATQARRREFAARWGEPPK